MFILKTGHQPGVYVPLRALFLVFESIILILAGNEDMHESLNEFKFRPDNTKNTRVICPSHLKNCCIML